MASANIAVPAQAMSWGASWETTNSSQLRSKMVEDIKAKSATASMISDSVLGAMKVVPRHLFVDEKKIADQQRRVSAAYAFDQPMPTTANSRESSPEMIGAQLSMTEIIQGQSVLVIGIKGGYLQAVIAQLVGMNGSVVSVTASDDALKVCRDRINCHCPLRSNVDWIPKVSNIKDIASVASVLKRQKKLFHTVICGFAVAKFPMELREALHEDGTVSILAPVKSGGDGVRFQLYLRRGDEDEELRTIHDFNSLPEDSC